MDNKRFMNYLKSGKYSMEELTSFFDIDKKAIQNTMEKLECLGVPIEKEKTKHGTLFYISEIEANVDEVKILDNVYDRFGIIADKHLGSKYCDKRLMKSLYKKMKSEGAKYVIDAGDLTDGIKVYKGQINEVETYGFDDATDLVISEHPDDLKTYVLGGNHDMSWINETGADILRAINSKRKDIIPIGYIGARIVGKDGGDIEVNHPKGSVAYARSYKGQKQIEQMVDRPDLLVRGHHHVAMYFNYLGTKVMEAGTVQKQTPYMKAKGLYPDLGGWIVDLEKNRIKLEWLE